MNQIDFNDVDIEEIKSPLSDVHFVLFLRERNIHDAFINEMLRCKTRRWSSIENFCNENNNRYYISEAFKWTRTKDGVGKWLTTSILWNRYIVKNNL